MRTPGWYWVRLYDWAEWCPLHWTADEVWLYADGVHADDTPVEIDERPISRSPAAPAGAVEAAILQEIRLWPKLRDALCTMSAECQREFSDEVTRKAVLASAATRAAQERRAAVRWALRLADDIGDVVGQSTITMRGNDAPHLRILASAATRAAQERRAAVEMREAAANLVKAQSWCVATDKIEAAIRALPIPGEEKKA